MSRLYDHLAGIVETPDGGFNMTRESRQYFNRFLRQHGKVLRDIDTHAGLIEALRQCHLTDFAALRQRRRLNPILEADTRVGMARNESQHRLVA